MANVKVAVRVRPLCKREEDNGAVSVVNIHNQTLLSITNWKIGGADEGDRHRERVKYFSFDYVFNSCDRWDENYASQEQVYLSLGPEIISAACDGYNTCLFAYGQTSSGKTYTMVGDEMEPGLIPRISEGLFNSVTSLKEDVTYKFEISFMEIYNERVRDLLAPIGTAKFTLRVREHSKDGPYVPDLSKHIVSDHGQMLALLEQGMINRTTASTHMHEFSSRSHAIFTIHFVQAKMEQHLPSEIVSKINLVDLAGSERANLNYSKDRMQEGANINKSLVMLGNCISALAENALAAVSMESLPGEDGDLSSSLKRKPSVGFVPYRNSVLTWLLKDSLGGNAKTIMIATVSPASIHYNETMSTLRYARRATHIVNQPIINEDPHVRLIRELRGEIQRLKSLLCSASLASSTASLSQQDNSINQMLQDNEVRVDQLTEAWVYKWKDAAEIMQECNVGIRRESVAVVVESELPHLISLSDDLSNGIILYHLQDGCTRIGTHDAATTQDIVLNHSTDAHPEHAIVMNENDVVTLYPMIDAKCIVNGVGVCEPVQLRQGAVILMGKANMFRFNHPKQAAQLRLKRAHDTWPYATKHGRLAHTVKNGSLRHGLRALAAANLSPSRSTGSIPESNWGDEDHENLLEQMSLLLSPRSLDRIYDNDEVDDDDDDDDEMYSQDSCVFESPRDLMSSEEPDQYDADDQQELVEKQRQVVAALKAEYALSVEETERELTSLREQLKTDREEGTRRLLEEIEQSLLDESSEKSIPKFVNLEQFPPNQFDISLKEIVLKELVILHSEKKAEANLDRKQAAADVQKMSSELKVEEEEKHLQEMERLVSFSMSSERLSISCSETASSSNSSEDQRKRQAGDPSTRSKRNAKSKPYVKGNTASELRRQRCLQGNKRSSSLSQKQNAPMVLPNKLPRSHSLNTSSREKKTADGEAEKASNAKRKLSKKNTDISRGSVYSRLYPQNRPKFEYLKKKDELKYEEFDVSRRRVRERGQLMRRDLSPSQARLPDVKSSPKRADLGHVRPKIRENEGPVNAGRKPKDTTKSSGSTSTKPKTDRQRDDPQESTPKRRNSLSRKRLQGSDHGGQPTHPPVGRTNSLPNIPSKKLGKSSLSEKRDSEPEMRRRVLKKGEKKPAVWQRGSPQRRNRLPSGRDTLVLLSPSRFPKKISARKECSLEIWQSLHKFPIQKYAAEAYYMPWNSGKCVSMEDLSRESPTNSEAWERRSSMGDLLYRSDEEVVVMGTECQMNAFQPCEQPEPLPDAHLDTPNLGGEEQIDALGTGEDHSTYVDGVENSIEEDSLEQDDMHEDGALEYSDVDENHQLPLCEVIDDENGRGCDLHGNDGVTEYSDEGHRLPLCEVDILPTINESGSSLGADSHSMGMTDIDLDTTNEDGVCEDRQENNDSSPHTPEDEHDSPGDLIDQTSGKVVHDSVPLLESSPNGGSVNDAVNASLEAEEISLLPELDLSSPLFPILQESAFILEEDARRREIEFGNVSLTLDCDMEHEGGVELPERIDSNGRVSSHSPRGQRGSAKMGGADVIIPNSCILEEVPAGDLGNGIEKSDSSGSADEEVGTNDEPCSDREDELHGGDRELHSGIFKVDAGNMMDGELEKANFEEEPKSEYAEETSSISKSEIETRIGRENGGEILEDEDAVMPTDMIMCDMENFHDEDEKAVDLNNLPHSVNGTAPANGSEDETEYDHVLPTRTGMAPSCPEVEPPTSHHGDKPDGIGSSDVTATSDGDISIEELVKISEGDNPRSIGAADPSTDLHVKEKPLAIDDSEEEDADDGCDQLLNGGMSGVETGSVPNELMQSFQGEEPLAGGLKYSRDIFTSSLDEATSLPNSLPEGYTGENDGRIPLEDDMENASMEYGNAPEVSVIPDMDTINPLELLVLERVDINGHDGQLSQAAGDSILDTDSSRCDGAICNGADGLVLPEDDKMQDLMDKVVSNRLDDVILPGGLSLCSDGIDEELSKVKHHGTISELAENDQSDSKLADIHIEPDHSDATNDDGNADGCGMPCLPRDMPNDQTEDEQPNVRRDGEKAGTPNAIQEKGEEEDSHCKGFPCVIEGFPIAEPVEVVLDTVQEEDIKNDIDENDSLPLDEDHSLQESQSGEPLTAGKDRFGDRPIESTVNDAVEKQMESKDDGDMLPVWDSSTQISSPDEPLEVYMDELTEKPLIELDVAEENKELKDVDGSDMLPVWIGPPQSRRPYEPRSICKDEVHDKPLIDLDVSEEPEESKDVDGDDMLSDWNSSPQGSRPGESLQSLMDELKERPLIELDVSGEKEELEDVDADDMLPVCDSSGMDGLTDKHLMDLDVVKEQEESKDVEGDDMVPSSSQNSISGKPGLAEEPVIDKPTGEPLIFVAVEEQENKRDHGEFVVDDVAREEGKSEDVDGDDIIPLCESSPQSSQHSEPLEDRMDQLPDKPTDKVIDDTVEEPELKSSRNQQWLTQGEVKLTQDQVESDEKVETPGTVRIDELVETVEGIYLKTDIMEAVICHDSDGSEQNKDNASEEEAEMSQDIEDTDLVDVGETPSLEHVHQELDKATDETDRGKTVNDESLSYENEDESCQEADMSYDPENSVQKTVEGILEKNKVDGVIEEVTRNMDDLKINVMTTGQFGDSNEDGCFVHESENAEEAEMSEDDEGSDEEVERTMEPEQGIDSPVKEETYCQTEPIEVILSHDSDDSLQKKGGRGGQEAAVSPYLEDSDEKVRGTPEEVEFDGEIGGPAVEETSCQTEGMKADLARDVSLNEDGSGEEAEEVKDEENIGDDDGGIAGMILTSGTHRGELLDDNSHSDSGRCSSEDEHIEEMKMVEVCCQTEPMSSDLFNGEENNILKDVDRIVGDDIEMEPNQNLEEKNSQGVEMEDTMANACCQMNQPKADLCCGQNDDEMQTDDWHSTGLCTPSTDERSEQSQDKPPVQGQSLSNCNGDHIEDDRHSTPRARELVDGEAGEHLVPGNKKSLPPSVRRDQHDKLYSDGSCQTDSMWNMKEDIETVQIPDPVEVVQPEKLTKFPVGAGYRHGFVDAAELNSEGVHREFWSNSFEQPLDIIEEKKIFLEAGIQTCPLEEVEYASKQSFDESGRSELDENIDSDICETDGPSKNMDNRGLVSKETGCQTFSHTARIVVVEHGETSPSVKHIPSVMTSHLTEEGKVNGVHSEPVRGRGDMFTNDPDGCDSKRSGEVLGSRSLSNKLVNHSSQTDLPRREDLVKYSPMKRKWIQEECLDEKLEPVCGPGIWTHEGDDSVEGGAAVTHHTDESEVGSAKTEEAVQNSSLPPVIVLTSEPAADSLGCEMYNYSLPNNGVLPQNHVGENSGLKTSPTVRVIPPDYSEESSSLSISSDNSSSILSDSECPSSEDRADRASCIPDRFLIPSRCSMDSDRVSSEGDDSDNPYEDLPPAYSDLDDWAVADTTNGNGAVQHYEESGSHMSEMSSKTEANSLSRCTSEKDNLINEQVEKTSVGEEDVFNESLDLPAHFHDKDDTGGRISREESMEPDVDDRRASSSTDVEAFPSLSISDPAIPIQSESIQDERTTSTFTEPEDGNTSITEKEFQQELCCREADQDSEGNLEHLRDDVKLGTDSEVNPCPTSLSVSLDTSPTDGASPVPLRDVEHRISAGSDSMHNDTGSHPKESCEASQREYNLDSSGSTQKSGTEDDRIDEDNETSPESNGTDGVHGPMKANHGSKEYEKDFSYAESSNTLYVVLNADVREGTGKDFGSYLEESDEVFMESEQKSIPNPISYCTGSLAAYLEPSVDRDGKVLGWQNFFDVPIPGNKQCGIAPKQEKYQRGGFTEDFARGNQGGMDDVEVTSSKDSSLQQYSESEEYESLPPSQREVLFADMRDNEENALKETAGAESGPENETTEESDDVDEIDIDSFRKNLQSVGLAFDRGRRYVIYSELFDPYTLSSIEEDELPELTSSPVSRNHRIPSYHPVSMEDDDVDIYEEQGEGENIHESESEPEPEGDEEDRTFGDQPEEESTFGTEWFTQRVEITLIDDIFTAEQDLPSDHVKSPDVESCPLQSDGPMDGASLEEVFLDPDGSYLGSFEPNSSTLINSPTRYPMSPVTSSFSPPSSRVSFASPLVRFSTASPCSSPESDDGLLSPEKLTRDDSSSDDVSDGDITPNVRRWSRAVGPPMKMTLEGDNLFIEECLEVDDELYPQEPPSICLGEGSKQVVQEVLHAEEKGVSDLMVDGTSSSPGASSHYMHTSHQDGDHFTSDSSTKRAESGKFCSREVDEENYPEKFPPGSVLPEKCNSHSQSRATMYTQTSPKMTPRRESTVTTSTQTSPGLPSSVSFVDSSQRTTTAPCLTQCTQTSPRSSPSRVPPPESSLRDHARNRPHQHSLNQANDDFHWDLFPLLMNFNPETFERSVSLPTLDNPLLVSPHGHSFERTSSERDMAEGAFHLSQCRRTREVGYLESARPGFSERQHIFQTGQEADGSLDDTSSDDDEDDGEFSGVQSLTTTSSGGMGSDRDRELEGEPDLDLDYILRVDDQSMNPPDGYEIPTRGHQLQIHLCARCRSSIAASGDGAIFCKPNPVREDANLAPMIWEPVHKEASVPVCHEDLYQKIESLSNDPPNIHRTVTAPGVVGESSLHPAVVTENNPDPDDDIIHGVIQMEEEEELVPERVKMPVFLDVSADLESSDEEEVEDCDVFQEEYSDVNIRKAESIQQEKRVARPSIIEPEPDSCEVDSELFDDRIEPELTALMSDSATPIDYAATEPNGEEDPLREEDSARVPAKTNTVFQSSHGQALQNQNSRTGDLTVQRTKEHANDYVLSVNINIPPFPKHVKPCSCNSSHYTPNCPQSSNAADSCQGSEATRSGRLHHSVEGWVSSQSSEYSRRQREPIIPNPPRFPSESTGSHLTSSSGVFTGSLQTDELDTPPMNRLDGHLSPVDSALSEEDAARSRNQDKDYLTRRNTIIAERESDGSHSRSVREDMCTPEGVGTQVAWPGENWTSPPELDALRDERDNLRRLSNSWDRSDLAVEMMEARMMHNIGETDAFLQFLESDFSEEDWVKTKNMLQSQHNGENMKILALERSPRRVRNGFRGQKNAASPSMYNGMLQNKSLPPSLNIGGSHRQSLSPQSQRESTSPSLYDRTLLSESAPPSLSNGADLDREEMLLPSEHCRYLQGLRKDLLTSRTTSLIDGRSEIEALLGEYRDLHRTAESEIAQAQRELEGPKGGTTKQHPRGPAGRGTDQSSRRKQEAHRLRSDGSRRGREIGEDRIAEEIRSLQDASLPAAMDPDRRAARGVDSLREGAIGGPGGGDRGPHRQLSYSRMGEPLALVKRPSVKSLKERLREIERQEIAKRNVERTAASAPPLELSDSECTVLIEQTLTGFLQESTMLQRVDLLSVERGEECGGWRFLSEMNGTFNFEKTALSHRVKWYSAVGFIRVPSSCVFSVLRKPSHLQGIIGKFLDGMSIVQQLSNGISILQLRVNKFFFNHAKMVNYVFHASCTSNEYVVGATSLKMMDTPRVSAAADTYVSSFGFCLYPLHTDGMEHCRITMITQVDQQVDFGGDLLPLILRRLPSSVISNVRGMTEIGHL